MWLGNDACSFTSYGILRNYSNWAGITCTNGRVTSVDLPGYGMSGPLELLGPLTAVDQLFLNNNSFEGRVAEACEREKALLQ